MGKYFYWLIRFNFMTFVSDLGVVETHAQPAGNKKSYVIWFQARRNTVKTLILVSICFIICWIWNQIYYLLFNLGYNLDFGNNFYHFTVIMVSVNMCVNPIIYLLEYEPFKRAARILLYRCLKVNKVNPSERRDNSKVWLLKLHEL